LPTATLPFPAWRRACDVQHLTALVIPPRAKCRCPPFVETSPRTLPVRLEAQPPGLLNPSPRGPPRYLLCAEHFESWQPHWPRMKVQSSIYAPSLPRMVKRSQGVEQRSLPPSAPRERLQVCPQAERHSAPRLRSITAQSAAGAAHAPFLTGPTQGEIAVPFGIRFLHAYAA